MNESENTNGRGVNKKLGKIKIIPSKLNARDLIAL